MEQYRTADSCQSLLIIDFMAPYVAIDFITLYVATLAEFIPKKRLASPFWLIMVFYKERMHRVVKIVIPYIYFNLKKCF